MKFSAIAATLAVLASATTALPAAAQDKGAPAASDNHVVIGAGALAYRSPFRGEGTSLLPIPILSIAHDGFYVSGLEAGYRFEPVRGGPVRPSIALFGAARTIAGNDREKVTGDVGVRVALTSDYGSVSLSYQHDATGSFGGGEAIARYEAELSVGPVTITPGVQAGRLDAKTANHIYGISARQQRRMVDDDRATILPIYRVRDAAVNVGGDLTITAPLSPRIIAIASIGATWLGAPIRKNPGLRDEVEGQALLGLAYRF